MNVRKDVWRTSTGCWPNLCEVHKYIRTLCYALLLCGPACLFILHNMALIDSYCCCSWTKGERTQEVSECIDSPNRYKKKKVGCFSGYLQEEKKNSICLWCFGLTLWIYSEFDWRHPKWIYAPEQWTEIRHVCNRNSNHNIDPGNYQPVNRLLANNLPVSNYHWFSTIHLGGKSAEIKDETSSNQDEDPHMKIRGHH